MDRDDYLKFCHETYRDELKEKDQFTPRQGFLLTGIVVLGGVVIKLSTLDRLSQCLTRIDVFLYYLATIGALVALVWSIFHLILSICPREYEHIAQLTKFDEWRESVRVELRRSPNNYADEEIEAIVADETHTALASQLNKASEKNVTRNDTKQKHLNLAIYAVFWGVGCLALQMIATLVYTLTHGKGP